MKGTYKLIQNITKWTPEFFFWKENNAIQKKTKAEANWLQKQIAGMRWQEVSDWEQDTDYTHGNVKKKFFKKSSGLSILLY